MEIGEKIVHNETVVEKENIQTEDILWAIIILALLNEDV